VSTAPRSEHQQTAMRALACLDLTSLGDADTVESIEALCDRGLDSRWGVRPAALCVFPRFAAQVSRRLESSGIATAVVVNFPGGDATAAAVIAETRAALRDGAREIDVVIPYTRFLAGDTDAVTVLVGAVVECAEAFPERVLVKAILETGALGDISAVRSAAALAVAAGADFLKTSTGKIPVGCTPESAAALMEVAARHGTSSGRVVGVKVSGGVRTVNDAAAYLALADYHFAPEAASPANFRIGASALYDDIVNVLSGGSADASAGAADGVRY